MKTHNQLLKLVLEEKQITSKILDALQITESNRSYLKMGYSSLFDYLVRGLAYSEATAYQRMACVRIIKDIPEIRKKIDSGVLSYTSVAKSYKFIRNKPIKKKQEILSSLEGKSTREASLELSKYEPALTRPKERLVNKRLQLTIELNEEEQTQLKQLQALKSHHGKDVKELFMSWMNQELDKYKPVNYKKHKSKNNRYVPDKLKNKILKKSGYVCEYPKCEQGHYLQIDHIIPIRRGGETIEQNLQVLCSAHNQFKG